MREQIIGSERKTTLYALPPKAVGSSDCESVGSYLQRLAFEHGVSYSRLKLFVSAANCEKPKRLAVHRVGTLSSTIAVLEVATGCNDLRKCALLPFRDTFLLPIAEITGLNRYCPACVAETPFPDAWGRLLWDIRFVNACPFHKLNLISSDCTSSPGGGWAKGPLRPGICERCGSVSYMCNRKPETSATERDLIFAQQIADLVAAASSGKEFDRFVAVDAALSLLKDEFGSVLEASRYLRMNVNTLYQLGRSRPPVELLMTMCAVTGAKLLSLLKGKIEYLYPPSDFVPKTSRRAERNAELALVLQRAAGERGVASINTLARSLRVGRRRLEAINPNQTAAIDKKANAMRLKERAIERRVRRQRLVQRLHEVKEEVEATGGRFTERVARVRTGIVFWTGTENHRILKLVLRGKL